MARAEPTDVTSDSDWPLAGMRVLDLSSEIAGPYCTKMLLDAGADVIKAEAPQGDPLRRWTASGTGIAEGEDGALFQHLNASKRSVVADLTTAAGRQLFCDLAARSDVVVESFAPGTLAAIGLTLDALQAGNPALSLVSISPWGGTGPWAHRPATEFTLQAATGSTAHRGRRDRVPVAAGGRLGEWVAGTFAAVGAVCAWLGARKTGQGQHVDVSMFEAMLLSLTYYFDLSSQWREGPLPRGVEVPSIEPAKDGWVGFCTVTGQQWKDFCVLIERPDLGEDERYLIGWERSAQLAAMQEVIHPWTRAHTVAEIIERATALRIPVAPVGNGENLPHMDHLAARGVFVTGPGGFIRPRPPYQLERTPLRPFGRAPKLGEHTEEVMEELETHRLRHGSAPADARNPTADSEISPSPTHLFRVGEGGGEGAQPRRTRSIASLLTPSPCPLPRGENARARVRSIGPPKSSRGVTPLPLAGLRVIDLTTFWAGPFAACYLAAMGADVVKVESIQRPDGMRFAGALQKERMWEWSAVFAGANAGKRAITLNLATPEGLALLRRLICDADVVMDNFSVRVLEQFGLTWDAVQALNARAIMLRMPAFGLDGPWRDRTGFAMTVEQVSGMAWITGYEDMPLVVRGACDPIGGMNAVFALLIALEHRRRTGKGQLVEVSLVEAALNIAAEQVIEYSAYGNLLQRAGNRGPCAAPQGVYRCAEPDEYVALAVATDEQWHVLLKLFGDPEWGRDHVLATAAGRRAAHDAIDARIERWLSTQPRDAAARRLADAGVPAHPLVNPHCVWPNPQLEHRRFFQVMQHPVTGPTRYPGFPVAFSALDRHLHRCPPPTLGQHNDEILGGELGLSSEELQDLRTGKIIGEHPSFV
jgi:crotonobetainyl-CoA:carnitine CoA-transferase CaiB-like acyl-CoA transferase